MGRYDGIIDRLARWARETDAVRGVIIVGSQARADVAADTYSDLDVVLVFDDPAPFVADDGWLDAIAPHDIAFLERTIGGDMEKRVLFEGALDVDMVLSSMRVIESSRPGGENAQQAWDLLRRGHRLLVDKVGIADILRAGPPPTPPFEPPSRRAFENAESDFWYHCIWAARKLLRGEMWIAMSCIDGYCKHLLLRMLEWQAHAIHGAAYDTWHAGRFVERWADPAAVAALPGCFARYDREDLARALLATMEVYRRASRDAAARWGYEARVHADDYATAWVRRALGDG